MNKTILAVGITLGLLAVVLGAFGAHGLKKVIGPEDISTFETGVKYQMYHALFLMILSILPNFANSTKMTIFYIVLIGVVLFSGSIYALATNVITSFDFKKIGFITPIGGTLLIVGWGVLLYSVLTKK
ncbi:DUF423 domain-containing protein [Croceitalea rosinachiae]|uniref:DUF423 domain-containing protein n=1 Tax=Croceitalea rosinachiae TaxID=3075596 RepID=A0ABU3A8Z3_9FLAO|nr:DUF423 domain-containing protein [Croceitalea sp. F388]MDT0606649.1 DUF423 domain-containing protein [Croceitalea sp. F388]